MTFWIIVAAILMRDAIKLAVSSILLVLIRRDKARKQLQKQKNEAYERIKSEEAKKVSGKNI